MEPIPEKNLIIDSELNRWIEVPRQEFKDDDLLMYFLEGKPVGRDIHIGRFLRSWITFFRDVNVEREFRKALCFDSRDGRVFNAEETLAGKSNEVERTKSLPDNHNLLLVAHNHPDEEGFSIPDFQKQTLTVGNEFQSIPRVMMAITKNGTYFSVISKEVLVKMQQRGDMSKNLLIEALKQTKIKISDPREEDQVSFSKRFAHENNLHIYFMKHNEDVAHLIS